MLWEDFKSRTRVGCDLHQLPGQGVGLQDFNPRTHAGCDAGGNHYRIFEDIFQSTHPRGVRHSWNWFSHNLGDFNPRTRVGCDSNKAQKRFILFLFYYTASPIYCQFAATSPLLSLSLLPCNCPHAVQRSWKNPVRLPFTPGAVAL